jgi:hypothetical protein
MRRIFTVWKSLSGRWPASIQSLTRSTLWSCWLRERFPESSFRRSRISRSDVGDSVVASGLIWMIQSSSGFRSRSTWRRSLIGGLCEKMPSQWRWPSISTPGKSSGTAVDARTASAVTSPSTNV